MQKSIQSSTGLLYGVMFMLLVFVARIQELFHFLTALHLGVVSVLLVLLLFMLSSRPAVQLSLLKIAQVKLVMGIFLLAAFSVPFSVWPAQSLEKLIPGYALTVFFFLMLIYAVNSFKDLHKLIWVYIFGVLLLAFFSIVSQGADRLSASSTYDPNDIAMLFVITLPIVYFFMNTQKGLSKLLLFVVLLTILFAFVLTVSRGGFVGLAIVAMLTMLIDKYHSWVSKILIMAVLIFAFLQFAPDAYWERIESIVNYEEDYNFIDEGGRITIWQRGMGFIAENPLTGVGFGAFSTAMGHAYGQGISGFTWHTAHNAFLQIGAEVGIGGLFLFMLLIASSMRMLRKLRSKYNQQTGQPSDYLWLSTALEISLWGYVATAMFLSAAYFPMFYFLIALCCILIKLDSMDDSLQDQALQGSHRK